MAFAGSGAGGTIDVKFHGNIAILTLDCGENRFNFAFFEKFHRALDEVERNQNIHALITTGKGKFYSNGIDLKWLDTVTREEEAHFDAEGLPSLYLRLMTFPMLTIAAINGHAYAGGAMLAFSHDYRIMRTKRGWICMNEVHINMRFDMMFLNLLRSRLPCGQVFHECVTLGKVYTAEEAVKRGLIDIACEENELIEKSKELVNRTLIKGPYNRDSLKNMKEDLLKQLFQVKTEHAKIIMAKL